MNNIIIIGGYLKCVELTDYLFFLSRRALAALASFDSL